MSIESTVFSEKVPQRVARNTAINVIGRVIGMIATLALGIAIKRVLGGSAYGQYVSVWAIVVILDVVAHMGTETIVVREAAADLRRAPELVSNAITIRLGLGIVAYGAAIVVAVLMNQSQAFVGYVAIAGLGFFVMWHSLIASYFDATLRIGTRTLLVTGSLLLTLALTMMVLFLKMGLGSVLWAAVFGNFVALVVAYLLICRHFRPNLGRNLTVMKNMLLASWPLAGIVFLTMLAARLNLLMVLKMKGDEMVGAYGATIRITESLGVIPQAFMLSVLPLMSFYHSREPARFGDIYRQSLKYMSVIILPLALLVSFYSEPILRVSYGEDFVLAAPALAIRAWFMFFVFIGNANYGAIVVENRQKTTLVVDVCILIPSVVLYLALISRYGIVGAALAEVLRQVVFYIVLLVIPSTRKYTLTSVTASFKPIVAASCAAACLYLVKAPFGVLLALPVYVLVLLLIRGINREDRELLTRMLKRT